MRRRKTYPGSIYKPANTNTLYIKYRSRRVATGLQATKEGYRIAELRLEQMYKDAHGLTTSQTVTVTDALLEFLHEHPNYLANTIDAYRYSIKSIFKADDFFTRSVVIQAVNSYVNKTSHSATTVNINLRHLQSLCNYYTELGRLESVALAKYKRKSRVIVKSYSSLEVYRLLKYFLQHSPEMAVLISLAYNTGARTIDLFSLLWEDVHDGYITWHNKKTKAPEPRPYNYKVSKLLARAKQLNPDDTHLTRWHYPNSSFPTKLLRRAFIELGIEQDGRAWQEFRVSFRMRLRRAGVPREVIQYFLRHVGTELIDKHYTDNSDDLREYLTKI